MNKPLASVLRPGSVAVIGASTNPDRISGRAVHFLQQFGYGGAIWPVNPRHATVQSLRAFPGLSAAPDVPDAVVIALPRQDVAAAVAECGDAGVALAVIMSSGFAETGRPDDIAAERAIIDHARARGMRIVGPNAQGLADFATGTILSFSTMFIEEPPGDGPVGIISQSGALSGAVYGMVRSQGVGVRYVHATGNDADLTTAELAGELATDPDLRVLLLYLENIHDAAVLSAAARTALEHDVAMVALHGGRSAGGRRAAQSHTGALATEHRVVDEFLRQHGIYRAEDLPSLVQAVQFYLRGWRSPRRRLIVLSNSGAFGVLAADAADRHQLPLADLQPDTITALTAVLPEFASTQNPVDITAGLLGNSALFSDTLPVLGRDPGADNLLIGLPVAGMGYDMERIIADVAGFADQFGRPVAVATPQASVAQQFRAAAVPVFRDVRDAIAAIDQLTTHAELRAGVRPRPGWPERAAARRPAAPARFWSEFDALALLARHGLPVVPHRLCRSRAEAVAALRELGRPAVAMKGCSASVPHKSELGLVRVGITGEDAVAATFDELTAAMAALRVPADGVLVAQLVEGQRELLLGANLDPVFGPVVLIGDGGKHAEVAPDVAVLLPPFSGSDVRRAFSRLRVAPLAAGSRGDPAWDLGAFCAAAVRLGDLAQAETGLVSIDLNPVIVGARQEGCTIVDALVVS